MKKAIFFILFITILSCSNDDSNEDTNIIIPDQIEGKWIIYKTEYPNTVYEHEINGQCGQEALEMFQMYASNYNYIMETYYINENCTSFASNNIGKWIKTSSNVYDIYHSGSIVPNRTLTLSNNEIKVTEPGTITVIKYYKKAI